MNDHPERNSVEWCHPTPVAKGMTPEEVQAFLARVRAEVETERLRRLAGRGWFERFLDWLIPLI